MAARPSSPSRQAALKSYRIREAWRRYNDDTKHLQVNDPDYRAKERRAWSSLQRTLGSIN